MEENRALVKPALRPLFLFCGWLSLILGWVGAFLPVLPTTPFLILSAYLFGKSSPRLKAWLLGLPTFGPLVKDWEENKVIRPKAKIFALLAIAMVMTWSIFFVGMATPLKIMQGVIWVAVSLFIITRKSRN